MAAPTASGPVVLRGVGLTKTFGSHTVFESLDIELRAGELVLLRGENGAGKSTLIDLLTGNQRADAGQLEVPERDGGTRELAARCLDPTTLARLGIVKCWQRPELFWSQTVGDNLQIAASGGEDSALRVLARALRGSRRRPVDGRLAQYPKDLDLEALAERQATALSFGQSRRVSIALAALVGHRALLLDEPLASLDRAGTQAVKRLLGELVTDGRRAVLVVEHALNERLLAGLRYRVLELRSRRLDPGVDAGEVAGAIRPSVELWTDTVEGATGLRRQGPAESLGDGGDLLRFRHTSGDGARPVLELAGLRVRRSSWELFSPERGQGDGLSLALQPGDVAFLLARNGWGKTSLAKVISGDLPAAAGQVRLLGQNVSDLPAWARRRRGLLYTETANALFGNLSVGETLRLKGDTDGVNGLPLSLRRQVRTLSGGERQRLALHCALSARDVRLLVLDEPFNGLDAAAVAQWLRLLETAAAQGKALLICLPA